MVRRRGMGRGMGLCGLCEMVGGRVWMGERREDRVG